MRNALQNDEDDLKSIIQIPSDPSEIPYERLRLRLLSVIFHIFGRLDLFESNNDIIEKLIADDNFHIEVTESDQLLLPLSSKKIHFTPDVTLIGIVRVC